MRKPHQHEQDGERFECADPDCRMPFKVNKPAPQARPRRGQFGHERYASRQEQHARYIDCGPQNWDDR